MDAVLFIGFCVLLGGVFGLFSVFLSMNHHALLGDALSHTLLPAVVIAQIFALPLLPLTLVGGVVSLLAISAVQRLTPLSPKVCIACVLVSFLAWGLFLASMFPDRVDLDVLLQGDGEGILQDNVAIPMAIFVISFLFIWVNYRGFHLAFYDPLQSKMLGMKPVFYRGVLFVLLLLSLIAALPVVGIFLLAAMLIIPALCANLLSHNLKQLLLLAVVFGGVSAGVAAVISLYTHLLLSACVVLVQASVATCLLVRGRYE